MKTAALFVTGLMFAICPVWAQSPELQIPKGSGIVSLDIPFVLGLSRAVNPSGTTYNSQSFAFKPVVSGGYFVTRNFMIGGGFGIAKTWYRNKNEFGAVNRGSSFLYVMPSFLLRYYYIFSPKVGFYAQYAMEGVFETEGPSPREHGMNMALSPRFVFFPSPFVGINAGMGELGYALRVYDVAGDGVAPAHTHNLLLLPTLHIGVSFFVGR